MEGDLGLGWCRGGSINNWDLHAVVRFACGATAGQGAPSSPPTDDCFPWLSQPQQPLLTDPTVDDLCFQAEAPQPSSLRNEAPTTQQPTPAADEAPAKPRPSGRGGGGPTRSNKRKTKKRQVHKEVTRVPAGSPSADLWAWRKYGQKPIKGSPYPRGYYRCSTDKNCKARKQVERCRADPATLIITYTGEHSHPVPLHRNSLAGTTRNKPQLLPSEEPQQARASDSGGGLSSSSPADTTKPQGSSSVGVEYEDKEDDETLSVRLLLEDTEMLTEEDALLFLKPDEPAPVVDVPGRAGGFDDGAMLHPRPEDDPAPAGGNGAGACDDVTLFPNKQPEEPGPVPVSSGGPDDVMLFPKPGEPQPMTVSANMTNGGARTASVINLADEIKQFSVSGLSAWEPAAAVSGWGL